MAAHDSHTYSAHGGAAAGKQTERRFSAEPTTRTNLQALVGGLGVAALGAGAYAAWMHDAPMAVTPYLLAASAAGIVAAWAMGSTQAIPLRVGDAGVAAERGKARPERIAWWEVEKVSSEGRGGVVVEGAGKRIVAAPGHHAVAAGFIVKEALERIPKRVSMDAERTAALVGAADEGVGTLLPIEPAQVTGRRCKASNVIISFERDARTCRRCGEVYDRRHVPESCLTCEAPMTSVS
jgi:hypothetical protein